jgi:hypothetical protein
MTATPPPWEVHPALARARLVVLARLAIEARLSALADAKRGEGDTNWGIGCRAYERFIHRVAKAARSAEHPWLDLSRDGLSVTILVDRVAIRAYTGRADKPESKHVLAARMEGEPVDDRQLALPFLADDPGADAAPWVWLMAVETDGEGRPTRVTFFQADVVGRTRNAWDAPVGEIVSSVHEARPPTRGKRARDAKAGASGSLFGD